MPRRLEGSSSDEEGDRSRPTSRQGDRSRSPSNEAPEDRQARLARMRRDSTRNLIPVTDSSQGQQTSRSEHTREVLEDEIITMLANNRNMPTEQRRQENQNRLDSLDPQYRDEFTKIVLINERYTMLANNHNMSTQQRRRENQNWLDSLNQQYRDEHTKIVLEDERHTMTVTTRDIPINQQRQTHQNWLNSIPQEYRDEHSEILLSIEQMRMGDELINQQQGEQSQQPLETTEQLNQSLGSLYRRGYRNITSTEQNLLDNALQVAAEITERRSIQVVNSADRRAVWLGHFLRGEVPPTEVLRPGERPNPTAVLDAEEIERESQSDGYREMRGVFLASLQAKMQENSTTS